MRWVELLIEPACLMASPTVLFRGNVWKSSMGILDTSTYVGKLYLEESTGVPGTEGNPFHGQDLPLGS
jgi:hypothetical protein